MKYYDDDDDNLKERLSEQEEQNNEETKADEVSQTDEITESGRSGASMDIDDETQEEQEDDNNLNRHKNNKDKDEENRNIDNDVKNGEDLANDAENNIEEAQGTSNTPSTNTGDMTTGKVPKEQDGTPPDSDPTSSQSSPGRETPANDEKLPTDSSASSIENGSGAKAEPLGQGELGAGNRTPGTESMPQANTTGAGMVEGGTAEAGMTAAEGSTAATGAAEGAAASAAGGAAAEGGAAAAGGATAGAGGIAALGIAAIVILVIIALIGVAGFFMSMPQFLWNRLKQMAVGLWEGFIGYFVGMDEATVHDDDIKAVAQYLKDMGYDLVGMGFAESVTINERDSITGKLKDEDAEENQILDIDAPYLKAYLVAENRTYMIDNYTFNMSDAVASIFKTGSFFKEGTGTWGTGLIRLDSSLTDAFTMPFEAFRIADFNVGELARGVKIDRDSNTLRIRRLNFDWFNTHNDYTYYSLAGWSGRYGKPFELSLTLHVATMAPDLVKEFCMNDALDAKVNIRLRNSDIKGDLSIDGKTIEELEESGTYDEQTINELKNFRRNTVSTIKTKIPYISSVTKHWFRNVYFEGTDSIGVRGKSIDVGVDEDGDDIEDYNEPTGEKTQVTRKLTASDSVYSFGGTSETGEFDYLGDGAPDVGGSKITINGTFTNSVVQVKDAVRGVTNPVTKELFKDKYYIYDGTVEKAQAIQEAREKNDEAMKEEIKMTKESLSAFSILESSETLDAQFIYRDLKELVIELGYFEREDFDEKELETLLWPLPEFKRKGWPDRKYEKQVIEYGTLMLCKETVDKIKEAERAEEDAVTKELTSKGNDNPSSYQNTTTSGGGEVKGGSNPNGSKVKSKFSPETAAIVEQHLYDFDRYNLESKLASYGGFESYCKNQLGGVFARWTGVDNVADVQTVDEFQEIAEYVWGLMTIYGFDYSNGDPGHYGTWRHADKISPDDSFHHDSNPNLTSLPERNIDKICNGSQGVDKVVVNCNWGADYLMFKCGIFSNEDPSKPTSSCAYVSLVNNYGCPIITNKEDLRPGDLIECFRTELTDLSDPSSWGSHSWFHVCTVGEVDEIADTITIYDAGHFFTESGNYKHVIKRSGDYFPYTGWAGIRVADLADEGLIGFPPDKDVIAMAKGEVVDVYADGENYFTESYLSTQVYGKDMTEPEEEWEFAASEQTDEGVRIKISEGPLKGYHLIIYGFDVDDSVTVGMQVEAEDVIGKTIKSNMCFVLIDREKGVVENVEEYVMKPEDEERLKVKDDFDVSDEANFVKNPATFVKMFKGYDNIIANTQAFLDMQAKYHVSAAFAACVTIAESSGGTNWSAISPSTYNWFSIKGEYNGQSQGEWKSYPSFAAAVDDFGDVIANSDNYYKKGKRTVNQIGPTYCNSTWSETVNKLMKESYENVLRK